MKEPSKTPQALVVGLIALGVIARLVPHPWNASPVAAIALFGGAWLSKRWSVILPLMIVAFSDLFLGLHATMPFLPRQQRDTYLKIGHESSHRMHRPF